MSESDRVTPQAAWKYAADLASAGKENFAVLSRFVPAHLKPDFAAIYAFCRWADDLADEIGSSDDERARSLELLRWFQSELDACYAGQPPIHPVFQVLQSVIHHRNLPKQLFDDLLDAFKQDQRTNRYDTLPQVLSYCKRSADPVGRLILKLGGHHDAPNLEALSDAVCTGLQLINFWQDVRRDLDRLNRIYLPLQSMGLDEATLRTWLSDRARYSGKYAQHLRPLVEDAKSRLQSGQQLPAMVDRSIARPIWLFVQGGLEVARAIEHIDYQTLWHRPRVSNFRRMVLLTKVIVKA
jgi:squalene synthase HpnC